MEKDNRGLELKMQHFCLRFDSLVNESNLPVGPLMYILKDYLGRFEKAYQEVIDAQFQKFCEEDEIQEENNEEKAE